jgi:hypothetical protein
MTTHFEAMQDTIQGIAESLARRAPGTLPRDHWEEAIGIYNTQFQRDVLPPKDDGEK